MGEKLLAAMVWVPFHCFLRSSEFLSLKIGYFDLGMQMGTVRLDETKTSSKNGAENGASESVVIDDKRAEKAT